MNAKLFVGPVLLLLADLGHAQQDFSKVDIKTIHVAKKEFHEMLVETSGIVENALTAGKTLEQTKADGLPAKWKSWEAPTLSTSRWLEILYQGLTRK